MLDQRRVRRADRQRGAVDVRQDHRLPVLHVALTEPARPAEARVGERDVDPAVLVERAPHERLLVVPLGDVAADGDRLGQFAGERLQLVLGAGGQHEPVAGLGGLAGGLGADAGGRAGDQEHGFLSHGSTVTQDAR